MKKYLLALSFLGCTNIYLIADDKQEASHFEIHINDATYFLEGEFNVKMGEAIQEGDLAKVEKLFCEYPDRNNVRTLSFYMVMAGACDQIAIVKKLIQLGANVNGRVMDIQTLSLVEKYVGCGYCQDSFYEPIFIGIVGRNNINFVKVLLDANVDQNITDIYGRTALMYAANHGYMEMVQMLIEADAYIDKRDQDGLTALDYAQMNNQEEVLGYLIAKNKNSIV